MSKGPPGGCPFGARDGARARGVAWRTHEITRGAAYRGRVRGDRVALASRLNWLGSVGRPFEGWVMVTRDCAALSGRFIGGVPGPQALPAAMLRCPFGAMDCPGDLSGRDFGDQIMGDRKKRPADQTRHGDAIGDLPILRPEGPAQQSPGQSPGQRPG
jgi:hypothetical protein